MLFRSAHTVGFWKNNHGIPHPRGFAGVGDGWGFSVWLAAPGHPHHTAWLGLFGFWWVVVWWVLGWGGWFVVW